MKGGKKQRLNEETKRFLYDDRSPEHPVAGVLRLSAGSGDSLSESVLTKAEQLLPSFLKKDFSSVNSCAIIKM